MSTIADVAARAGVSKATASRALTGRGYVSAQTRQRVTDAARALSYVAHPTAMSLATGRTHLVGVIVPTLDRWFFAQLVEGIQEALIDTGYDLALYPLPRNAPARERLFDVALPRRRFDGLIAAGLQPEAWEMERLSALARPLVTIGTHHGGIAAVAIDDAAAARIATEHLLDLGHSRIVFLGGATTAAERSFSDGSRLDGYRAAMTAAGLPDLIRTAPAAPTMPGGFAAAVDLLGDRRGRPTAVVGVCDEAAIGAIIAARRLGIAVPTELSVVGIDDHRHADMFALTTIRQDPRAQGADAVRLLHAQFEHPEAAPENVDAASALVVRNSTAAPR